MPPLELPEDRLSSLDEQGARQFLQPADVKGRFRRWRSWFYSFLIILLLALPWIKVDGQQSVLLNLPDRLFIFFGFVFRGHDGPYLFFILAILALTLALVTAIWGRLWCGWACPQTVFIDHIFRRIETWVEGNHVKRIALNKREMDFDKFRKKLIKWSLFTVVSVGIAHSFAAYFVGAESLIQMMQSSPKEHWTTFLVVFVLAGLTLFDFGWFREQFCIIMCPYGRFQSVLMDKDSMAVLYDYNRGEPRKSKNVDPQAQGDCINCYKCVQVCPTGIDIRRGNQMECIACTACIDACDEIMAKVDKPKGLIRYASESELEGKNVGKNRWVRPLLYGALIAILSGGFLYTVGRRSTVDITFIRAIESPYQIIKTANGVNQVSNHFNVNVKNSQLKSAVVDLRLPNKFADRFVLVKPMYPLVLSMGEIQKNPIFIRFEQNQLSETGQFTLPIEVVIKMAGQEFGEEVIETKTLSLLAPIKKAVSSGQGRSWGRSRSNDSATEKSDGKDNDQAEDQ